MGSVSLVPLFGVFLVHIFLSEAREAGDPLCGGACRLVCIYVKGVFGMGIYSVESERCVFFYHNPTFHSQRVVLCLELSIVYWAMEVNTHSYEGLRWLADMLARL